MTTETVLSITADDPCLAGHFPGRPVVPGVLLLDAAIRAILTDRPKQRVATLEAVKFTTPVLPGQEVRLRWQEAGADRVAFTGLVGAARVLSGRARLAAG